MLPFAVLMMALGVSTCSATSEKESAERYPQARPPLLNEKAGPCDCDDLPPLSATISGRDELPRNTSVGEALTALARGELNVRRRAAFTLARFSGPRVVAALLDAARSDENASVRAGALFALRRHSKRVRVESFRAAMDDSSCQVRAAAIELLA